MSQSLPSPPIVFESEIENVALNTETVAGIRAIASSGQDPPDRVRPPCGGPACSQRARQTGELQLLGLQVHLWTLVLGQFPSQEEIPAGPPAEQAHAEDYKAA